MDDALLQKLRQLLALEGGYAREIEKTSPAQRQHEVRNDLLGLVREVGKGGDLSRIIAVERAIVEGDLTRYANSRAMTHSLTAALVEITAIERHIGIVDDPSRYQAVDQAHSLPRNRKSGLPFDEARQALTSHYARLGNMDKSRLGGDEKKIIDARKSAIFSAGKLYVERQAKTLG
jgi:hypothetical protein